jgi:hypothetical protein
MGKKSKYWVILDKFIEESPNERFNNLVINADEAEIWNDEETCYSYVIFKHKKVEVFRVQEDSIVAYGQFGNAERL